MTKEQAIQAFFSGFGIPAYEENAVPTDANLPYLTYTVETGSFGSPVSLDCQLFYRSTSWTEINAKKEQIAAAIGGQTGKLIPCNGGYIYLTHGTPFSNHLDDPSDAMIRRIAINISVAFYTAD